MTATTIPHSRTEQFLLAFRRMPLVQQVIPQEAGIGWPLPRRKDNRLYVAWPFHGLASGREVVAGRSSRAEQGHTDLFPIFATLTIDWATKLVVEYVDLRYVGLYPADDPPGPVGRFPHPAIAGLTVGQYRQAKSELLALYDRLFDTLSAGGVFAPEFLQQFGSLFARLLEPGLEPQYRQLAGPFIKRFLGEQRV